MGGAAGNVRYRPTMSPLEEPAGTRGYNAV